MQMMLSRETQRETDRTREGERDAKLEIGLIGTKCCRDGEKEREEGRGMDPERQRWREGDRDTERQIEIQ